MMALLFEIFLILFIVYLFYVSFKSPSHKDVKNLEEKRKILIEKRNEAKDIAEELKMTTHISLLEHDIRKMKDQIDKLNKGE